MPQHDPAKRLKATLIGSTAVLMWGTLALFPTLTGPIPPFQLAAMSFGIASAFVVLKWLVRREDIAKHLRQPIGAWVLGTLGLFGYHFFYFMALRNAPPVEAGLIAYMWPLLIVVGSSRPCCRENGCAGGMLSGRWPGSSAPCF
mgnify:CR=1 FL=1